MSQKKRRRISFVKTDSGIAGYRSSSAETLTKIRDEKIKTGEIYIGYEVYPTANSTQILLNDEGKVVTKKCRNPARVIELKVIRQQHLELMAAKNLLRLTNFQTMDHADLLQHASKMQGNTWTVYVWQKS
jgi:hypothetical protein